MKEVAEGCAEQGMSQKETNDILKKNFKKSSEATIKSTVSRAFSNSSPSKSQSTRRTASTVKVMNAEEKEKLL